MYPINFTATEKKFYLSLHYNRANSYLLVNGAEVIKFKANDSEIVANPLCLGNISEDFSRGNLKKAGLYGAVFDFSVDYRAIAVMIYYTVVSNAATWCSFFKSHSKT